MNKKGATSAQSLMPSPGDSPQDSTVKAERQGASAPETAKPATADAAASAAEPEAYKVGPGRPPKHSRWKKGESGNPGGRPKGLRSLDDIFRALLRRKSKVYSPNGEETVETIEGLALSALQAAFKKGSVALYEMIFKIYDRIAASDAASAARSETDQALLLDLAERLTRELQARCSSDPKREPA